MKINNMDDYAKTKKYIVFRIVDGENWFYDAWDDFEKALKQAVEEGGQVAPMEAVEV